MMDRRPSNLLKPETQAASSGALVPQCRPGSGDDDWGRAARRRAQSEATRRASRPSRSAIAWLVRTWCGALRMAGAEAKLQINSPPCKPICKPDAARQHEIRETEPTERDVICPVRRGHYARERQHETAETGAIWLITQRRITRGTRPGCRSASCSDCTGYRTGGTRGAGIIRRPGPRTGPRGRGTEDPYRRLSRWPVVLFPGAEGNVFECKDRDMGI
jgi:hypothetical protein